MWLNSIAEEDTKATKNKVWDMGLEHSFMRKGENIQESGARIKCKAVEPFTMWMGSLHTKDSGVKTSFMDMECYIIRTPFILQTLLIGNT